MLWSCLVALLYWETVGFNYLFCALILFVNLKKKNNQQAKKKMQVVSVIYHHVVFSIPFFYSPSQLSSKFPVRITEHIGKKVIFHRCMIFLFRRWTKIFVEFEYLSHNKFIENFNCKLGLFSWDCWRKCPPRTVHSGGSRISQRRDANHKGEDINLLFWPIFPKTASK